MSARSAPMPRWARLLAHMPILRGLAVLLTSRHYLLRGDSMTPGFERGQVLLVDRMAPPSAWPARGDLVILLDPRDAARRLLKRIVGLPGEEVRIQDAMVLIDGVHLAEPYLGDMPASFGLVDATWRLGEDEYFVMGDNRVRSTDSREFGPVCRCQITGRAWFRYWPPAAWGRVG